ncbi:MAG: SRPBCC family protein [Chloroflexota bacterium]|nr:SRPBCC family protein [Chloroflexota bacterium]
MAESTGYAVHSSIVINRPIEDVFAVLTNVENTGKWFPGNVKEWWTSPPPHGVGSTRRARVKMGQMTTENDAVTTVYEPPHRAGMKGTSKNAPFDAMLTFEPVDGGTRVESNIELSMSGPAKLFGGMFTRWYGKSWDHGLVNLKRMMESGEL